MKHVLLSCVLIMLAISCVPIAINGDIKPEITTTWTKISEPTLTPTRFLTLTTTVPITQESKTPTAVKPASAPVVENCPAIVDRVRISDDINILYFTKNDQKLWKIDQVSDDPKLIAQLKIHSIPLLDPGNQFVYWEDYENNTISVYDLGQDKIALTKKLPHNLSSSYIGDWTSDGKIMLLVQQILENPNDYRRVIALEYAILDPISGTLLQNLHRNYDLPGSQVYGDYSKPIIGFVSFNPYSNLVFYNRVDPETFVDRLILWDTKMNEPLWESELYDPIQAPYISDADQLWSMDGTKVAYIGNLAINIEPDFSINILSVNDKALFSINDPDNILLTFIPYLRWSPDDKYLHFMGWKYPRSKYVQKGYLLDLSSRKFKTICHPVSSFISGTFLNNQYFVFLASSDETYSEIWILDVEAWAMKRLVALPNSVEEVVVLGPGISLHDY